LASIVWHPSVIPLSAIQVMNPQKGSDAGTSSKTHGDTPGQNCAGADVANDMNPTSTPSRKSLRTSTAPFNAENVTGFVRNGLQHCSVRRRHCVAEADETGKPTDQAEFGRREIPESVQLVARG
jgi:hypothetical protein